MCKYAANGELLKVTYVQAGGIVLTGRENYTMKQGEIQ